MKFTLPLLVVLVCAAPAAAFPGANGAILWSSGGDIVSTAGPITQTPATEAQAAWSADGKRVAYRVGAGGSSGPYGIAVDGTRIGGSDHHETQPGWTPDGRIVYRRSVPGENLSGDVWVMNADGTGAHALVTSDQDERYPVFSPDGTRIAFTRGASIPTMDIWVANADGSGAHLLIGGAARESAPSWSPDGTRIAFERGPDENSPVNEIWTASAVDGSGQQQLTSNDLIEEGPSFSPDGTQIAFTRGATEPELDIWRMNADGTGQTPVNTDAGRQESSDWQPLPRGGATTPPPTIAPGEPTPGQPAPPPTAPSRLDTDRDRDGLTLRVERRAKTSDLDRDTDDDGLSDGRERLRTKTSPRRFDTDRDGRSDGYELGVARPIADPPGPVGGTKRSRFRPDPTPRATTNPLSKRSR
jgi:dipeptidyl aminopeptidase/acylaminoacyl peptidase